MRGLTPKLTDEEVDRRLAVKGYERISQYLGTAHNLTVRCIRHGEVYTVKAIGLISDKKHLKCCGIESIKKKMTGRTVSDEFRRKCSDIQKNSNAYWYGKSLTKEHRYKIAKSGAEAFSKSIDRHIEHATKGVTAGKPGFFYIFKVGNLFKFGSVSRMSPEARAAKIRRDTGQECTIVISVRVDDAGAYEAAMMRKHRNLWVRGEYFKIPERLENAYP